MSIDVSTLQILCLIVIVLLGLLGSLMIFFVSRRVFGKNKNVSERIAKTAIPSSKKVSPAPQAAVQVSSDFGKVRVFISYRRNPSWGQARAIANDLEARGADVFFDVDSINEGHFSTVITNGVKLCDYFVLILAPDTLQSEWVQREVLLAQKHNKTIIPLLVNGAILDEAKLPENMRFVASYNGIQLIPEYYTEGIDRLASRFLKIQ